MTNLIDPRAVIDPRAKLAHDVKVGAYSIIGPDVEIGEGTEIGPHVVIQGPTKIGKHNHILQFTSLGEAPQHKQDSGETSRLEIGDHNMIREYCTINRGTAAGRSVTSVGHHNWFMAHAHVAHDCEIGNHTVFTNHASTAGHVVVEDYAVLSGYVGVHQFCHIGRYSFVGAASIVFKDVLPYTLMFGHVAEPCGINLVGLKRHHFDADKIQWLRRAYRVIFRQSLKLQEAIEQLKTMVEHCAEIQHIIDALERSTRGISR